MKKKDLDTSLKLLVRTSLIVFIGLIFSKVLGYIYRIIIARHFGPEVYGMFSLALTITGFFTAIAAIGYSAGLSRYIPLLRGKNDFDAIRYIYKKTLRSYTLCGIVAAIILFFTSRIIALDIFHNESLVGPLKIMATGVLFIMLTDIYIVAIRAFEEIGWYSFLYNILQNILRVLVLFSLIYLGLTSGVNTVVLSFISSAIITLIASYFVSRYKIKELFKIHTMKDYSAIDREFFNYSWPIMFFGIVSTIFYWIDTFSIGFYKSALQVGWYNAAVPIAMLISFIPELFMQLFFPMITREYSNRNYKLIEQLSKQVTKWIFMFTLPIFILIFLFPGAALNILFGENYIVAQDALRLLLLGSFVSTIFVVSNNLISMLGKSKIILMNMTIAAILNFVLNMFLVPANNLFGFDNSNGLLGASFSTLLSVLVLNLLFLIQTKKYLFFIPLKRKMITIFLISIIPTVLLFYIRKVIPLTIISITIISVTFFIIYFFLILISKSFDENDWMIIRSSVRKLLKYKLIFSRK
jgi:O-antigen/teichoic acid export membrane protein